MIEIAEYGGVYAVDSVGRLIPEGSRENIVPPWSEAVAFLVRGYQEVIGEHLHSVYIRGSVARGLAVEGLSDLDTTAVARPHEVDWERAIAWGQRTRREYAERFPFSHRPEIDVRLLADLIEAMPTMRWFKLSAACVYGEDLLADASPVTLDEMIAATSVEADYIAKVVSDFHEGIAAEGADTRSYCRWICKRFLRAASALVLSRTRKVTNDLYYCYKLFSEHYPEREPAMRRALELALNPITETEAYATLVEDLRDFFIAEANAAAVD